MPKPITISRRSTETAGSGRVRRPDPPSLADTVPSFGEAGPEALAALRGGRAGYSLVELVFVAGLVVTVSGIAAPQLLSGLDEYRTAGAARYVSTRMQRARMDAVMRSSEVAIQFTQTDSGYTYAVYRDGNHNGVRTSEIQGGADPPVGSVERLPDHFTAVDFGVQAGLPAVDGGVPPGNDPIRLGVSNLASFSSSGTATSGSVYVRGRHAQYVVRIFGATGKVRVLKFDRVANQWKPL
jgi:type II secretory pathway pseudopilin PulG